MSESGNRQTEKEEKDRVAGEVSGDIRRKLEARRKGRRSVWFGLGMFGLVGWSIALPTLFGLAVGVWLDRRLGTGLTWTAALLVVGVVLGCWNAWRWIQEERPKNKKEEEK